MYFLYFGLMQNKWFLLGERLVGKVERITVLTLLLTDILYNNLQLQQLYNSQVNLIKNHPKIKLMCLWKCEQLMIIGHELRKKMFNKLENKPELKNINLELLKDVYERKKLKRIILLSKKFKNPPSKSVPILRAIEKYELLITERLT